MRMTAVAVAGAAASTGIASAAPSGLNFESDLIPELRIENVTATIGSVEGDMGALNYYDDAGEVQDLSERGAVVAPRESEDKKWNPVSLRADKIADDAYYAYPRDETYEDANGDTQDLNVLDAMHWTTDGSGSVGSISVSDKETPASQTGLNVSTSSQGSGDTALASFTDGSQTDGVDRTYLQVGFTVNSIESGTTFEVRVRDGDGNYRAVEITDGGDTSNTNVIGSGTETSKVAQVQLGELSGTLNAIEELEIAVSDGNADVDLFALNAERSTRWGFGTQEYEPASEDTDVDTQTVYQPSGTYSVTSYDALPDRVRNTTVNDLMVEVEFHGERLADRYVDFEFGDAERYSQDQMFRLITNFDLPASYDLDLNISGDLTQEQMHPSSRYVTVRYLTGDHEVYDMSNVDENSEDDGSDDMDGATDATGKYDGSIGDTVTITTAVNQGQNHTVHHDIQVSDSEASEINADEEGGMEGGGGFGGGGRQGDGFLDSLVSIPGAIITAVVGFVGARAAGLTPGSN